MDLAGTDQLIERVWIGVEVDAVDAHAFQLEQHVDGPQGRRERVAQILLATAGDRVDLIDPQREAMSVRHRRVRPELMRETLGCRRGQ